MRLSAIAAPLLAIATAGSAVAGGVELDIIGTMNAELDGVPGEWVTIEGEFRGEEGATANLTKTEFPHMTMWSITMQGHDPEGDNIMSENVVMIEASVGRGDDAPQLSGREFTGEVMYLKQNGMRPEIIYIAEEGEVVIDTLEFEGARGHVRGSASGHGCRVDMSDLSAGADEDDCMQIEAEFDTEIVLDVVEVDM